MAEPSSPIVITIAFALTLFKNIPNKDAGWADDRYAAFGIVEEGMDFISSKMNNVKVQPPSNTPVDPIRIIKSGVL